VPPGAKWLDRTQRFGSAASVELSARAAVTPGKIPSSQRPEQQQTLSAPGAAALVARSLHHATAAAPRELISDAEALLGMKRRTSALLDLHDPARLLQHGASGAMETASCSTDLVMAAILAQAAADAIPPASHPDPAVVRVRRRKRKEIPTAVPISTATAPPLQPDPREVQLVQPQSPSQQRTELRDGPGPARPAAAKRYEPYGDRPCRWGPPL
jgi:hypothetical protein